jgi:hypothetical protein
MHSFEVSLGYESVDRSTFSMTRASCWKCSSINAFIPPMKLQKNAFNSYNYIQITQKFNIVELFVVNFICVRLFAVGNYYAIDCLHLTSSCASLDLSFIGMWNISFIIMWPLHNQSYCNISMKNGSNVIILSYLVKLYNVNKNSSVFQKFIL